MSALVFSYQMQIAFSQGVKEHRFTLKCVPPDRPYQNIRRLNVEISPEGELCHGTDSFGNSYLYGVRREEHTLFSVSVNGEAEITGQRESIPPEHQMGVYRMTPPLTAPGPALWELYRQLPPFTPTPERRIERAVLRMEQVFGYMGYLPGSTSHSTTAEQAALCREGVCQDYSHILLALLRMDGIPCRYLCGVMTGEGASHAWVEAAGEDSWFPLDPTNHCRADDGNYLVFAVGRDALDCQINRGIYLGSAWQTTTVAVRVACPEREEKEGL